MRCNRDQHIEVAKFVKREVKVNNKYFFPQWYHNKLLSLNQSISCHLNLDLPNLVKIKETYHILPK